MYIFKNAWKNIIRNKGRNILIGIIFIVIAASASISLAIRNSANSLINSYKESTDTTATITVNRDNMRQNMTPPSDSGEDSESNIEKISSEFKEASKISSDDIKNYADSKYVKSYYYSMSVGVDSDLTKVESSNMKFNKMSGNPNFKKIDNINAVVNFKVLLELLGIGLVLTIISSASSMIAIQRFSPLTILKERS